jgi:hypothetical protein
MSDYYSDPHIEAPSEVLPSPSEHAARESTGTEAALR